MAAALDIPVATNVGAITLHNDGVEVTCGQEAGGEQVIQMSLPCVIGAAKTLNTPRYPTLPDIIKARKKEIKEIKLESLGIGPQDSRMEIIGLRPAVEERRKKIIDGSPQEAVADRIR